MPVGDLARGRYFRLMAAAPTRVLLLRHGQSAWNAEGRWQGHADPPLSPLGEAQARTATEAVRALAHQPIEAIVASDLLRARATAELLAAGLGLGPVEVDSRLRERDAGEWTGLTRGEIEQQWPGFLDGGRRPPRFELDDAIIERVLAALTDLHRRHPGGHVVAVAHGGVVRALERRLGIDDGLVANLAGRAVELHEQAIIPGDRVVLVPPEQLTAPQQL